MALQLLIFFMEVEVVVSNKGVVFSKSPLGKSCWPNATEKGRTMPNRNKIVLPFIMNIGVGFYSKINCPVLVITSRFDKDNSIYLTLLIGVIVSRLLSCPLAS